MSSPETHDVDALARALFWRRMHGVMNLGLPWFGPPGLFFAFWGVLGFILGKARPDTLGIGAALLAFAIAILARAAVVRPMKAVLGTHMPGARPWSWSDGTHRCASEFDAIPGGSAIIPELERRVPPERRIELPGRVGALAPFAWPALLAIGIAGLVLQ